MSKKFIETVLLDLANERKVFWSEADFQFAFAWKLKEMFEDRNPQSAINVRLERRADALEQRDDKKKSGDAYIDIWVEINEKVYPIELKYKTIKCTLKDGADFLLDSDCSLKLTPSRRRSRGIERASPQVISDKFR